MAITLTPEQAQTLKALEARVKEVRVELARAKQAGIDVSELEEILGAADEQRKSLLRVYGTVRAAP